MAEIFAYILHKDGKVDDTAYELINAAAKIDPAAKVTAVVAGSGSELDSACSEAAKIYPAVWKIDNEALSYVNAGFCRLFPHIVPRMTPETIRMSRHRMFFDPGKAIRELGMPQRPAREALSSAVDWFRGSGMV